jgi:Mg-chelatase subunit ChlD
MKRFLPALPPLLLLAALCACTNPLDIDTPRDRDTDTTDVDTTDTLAVPHFSVTLAFDATGSMAGPGNATAKHGALLFIDSLDGVSDEAAVLWFNSVVTEQQGMTHDTALLRSAVNAIPAAGATAVYDAIYVAVSRTVANGVNARRRVIVFSDGGDNSSAHSAADVIPYATANGIPVSVIFCHTGGAILPDSLARIATFTGGTMHEIWTTAEADSAYTEILHLLRKPD